VAIGNVCSRRVITDTAQTALLARDPFSEGPEFKIPGFAKTFHNHIASDLAKDVPINTGHPLFTAGTISETRSDYRVLFDKKLRLQVSFENEAHWNALFGTERVRDG
jgi:hypothetical protein